MRGTGAHVCDRPRDVRCPDDGAEVRCAHGVLQTCGQSALTRCFVLPARRAILACQLLVRISLLNANGKEKCI